MEISNKPEGAARSILVADLASNLITSNPTEEVESRIAPFSVNKGKDAQLALADPKNRFVALVLNPDSEEPKGIAVIRFCKFYRPGLPIYVVYQGVPPYEPKEVERLGIHMLMEKPITYSALVDKIAPNLISLESKLAVSRSLDLDEAVDQSDSVEDSKYISILAEDFFASSKSYFDIFIKLASSKYLKVLRAGESFDIERLTSYLKKGVKYFYIDKVAQAQYVTYADHLATAVLSRDFSPEAKLHATLNHGEETIKFLKSQGLRQSTIGFAESFVKNVHLFVDTIDKTEIPELSKFMNDVLKYDHGVSTAMVAGLLAHELGLDGSRGVQIVGLSGFLHDIGQVNLNFRVDDEDEDKLTPIELAEYHTHPTLGANVLRRVRGVDAITLEAVAQHHERRTRKGYPNRLGMGSINKVSEIIGMSDQFTKILKIIAKQPMSDGVNFYRHLEKELFPEFSVGITDTFRSVFFPGEYYAKVPIKSLTEKK